MFSKKYLLLAYTLNDTWVLWEHFSLCGKEMTQVLKKKKVLENLESFLHLALREDAAEKRKIVRESTDGCQWVLTLEAATLQDMPTLVPASVWVCAWAFSQTLGPSVFVFENLVFGVYSSFRHDIFS